MLAAGSGAAKLLRGPALEGGRALALAEVVVGAAVILGAGLGLARARPLAWIAVAAAAVVITLSSVGHVRASLRDQARRAASEEARFRRFVERGDPAAGRGGRP